MRDCPNLNAKSTIDTPDRRLDKQLLHPRTYPSMIRLGRDRDGGYVVPEDQIRHCSLLISLGLSDDVSFDRDFLARNPGTRLIGIDSRVNGWFLARRLLTSSVKAVKYTLTGNRLKRRFNTDGVRDCVALPLLYRDPNVRLRKWVGRESGPERITLSEILALSPDAGVHDVFLKMDIEGTEYEIVPEILRNARRIRCIAAEFHYLDTQTADFNKAMRTLSDQFVVVHIHGNNWGAYDAGLEFPVAVEITLLNRDAFEGELPLSEASYPLEGLDRPCNPGKADYGLVFQD